MHDFTVWVSYGKWQKNWDIRNCLLHLIHLSSTRLRRCGRILSGICEPYCLITPDLTMRYCPILFLIDYKSNMRGLGGAHRRCSHCFNAQPTEGGCVGAQTATHAGRSFNTQPSEGGWETSESKTKIGDVSTHNHPEVGGYLKTSHRFSGSLLPVSIQTYKCGLAKFCGDRMRSSSASLKS